MSENSGGKTNVARIKWVVVLMLLGAGAVWPTGSVADRSLINAAFDALHFPAGYLLGMALVALVPGVRLGLVILRGVLGLGVALALEGVQDFVGRSPSWGDLLWGCAGLVPALLWQRAHIRRWVVVLVILAVPASLYPLYGVIRAVMWRADGGEVIGDFEERWHLALWSPNEEHTRVEWARGRESISGSGSLRVVMRGDDGYSGVSSAVGDADWSRWTHVEFRVRNLGPPISLGVRIRDARWSGVHADQLNWGAMLPEGDSEWRIDLEDMLGSARKLERWAVRDLSFFVQSGPGAKAFLLDDVVLE